MSICRFWVECDQNREKTNGRDKNEYELAPSYHLKIFDNAKKDA